MRLRHALYARDIELIGKRQRANRWRAERGKPLMPEWEHYGDHLTPVVLLSLLTGMDIGDVLDLRVDQVDFGNACIRRQRNKTSHKGKVRVWTIPLCNEAGLILERWLRERRITSGLVFTGPTGGKMTSIKTGWRRIVKDADLAGFRAKDLRHSYASWLVQDGVSLFTVSQLLCHSSIAMTQVYAHLSPGHTAEAVAGTFDNDNDEGGQLASKEL